MRERVVLYSILTLFGNYNRTFKCHLTVTFYQNEFRYKDGVALINFCMLFVAM